MTSIERDRFKSDRKRPDTGIWVAQLLCFATVITALAAGGIFGLLVVSTSLGTTARIAAYSGIAVFGWCSISFLLGAIIAAASAA